MSRKVVFFLEYCIIFAIGLMICFGIFNYIIFNINQKKLSSDAKELLILDNCEKIKNSLEKEECFVYVISELSKKKLDIFSCIEIEKKLENKTSAKKYYEKCINNVYYYLAKSKNDDKICKSISEKEFSKACSNEINLYYLYLDESVSICKKINNPQKQFFCYKTEFSKIEYTPSYCDKYYGEIKNICLNNKNI